jgi:ribonuclease Z
LEKIILKIHILGVGGPGSLTNMRAGSSEVITIGNDKILVDCGWLVSLRLFQFGIKPWDINWMFFTHYFHPDHTVDYQAFAFSRLKGRGVKVKYLKVYGPRGIKQYSENLFNEKMIPDMKEYDSWNVWLSMEVNDAGSGLVCEAADWSARAVRVNHIGMHGEPSLAYRIDSSEGSIAISGDVGPARRPHKTDLGYAPNKDLIKLAHGVDVFIMDSSGAHTTPEDLGKAAKEANPKKIILSHGGQKPFQLDHAELCRKIGKYYKGEIILGEELKTYTV